MNANLPESRPLLLQGAELVAPPTRTRVWGSLLLALMATLAPWDDRMLWLAPDLTLMVLLYWNIHSPRLAGLGMAFLLGLVADVAHGVFLGLNALAYCAAAVVVLTVRRRLEGFEPLRQMPQLAPVLIGKEALVLGIGVLIGRGQADWRWLAAGVVASLLWLPLAWSLDRLTGRPHPTGKGSV